jgi:proteasome accessory factor B
MPRQNPLSEHIKVQRILRTIETIADLRHDITVYDLMDMFHVDRRTVVRDLSVIAAVGFGLRPDAGRLGKRKILKFRDNVPLSRPVGFSEDELSVLYLTRNIYAFLRGSHFEKAAGRAIAKIEPLFSDEKVDRLKNAVRLKTGPVRDYTQHSEVIRTLTEGILKRRTVKMSYSSKRSMSFGQLVLLPYTLVFYRNALYIVGFSEKHGAVRTFAVERIGRAQVQGGTFEMPADLDAVLKLDQYFGIYSGSVEKVSVRITPEYKYALRDVILHPSQKARYEHDGSITLELLAAGKEDLFQWVLSQGEAVELLAPMGWVKELKEKIRKMAELYAG